MNRQSLSAIALVVYGALLTGVYLYLGFIGGDVSLIRVGPFILISLAIGYAGFWLVQNEDYHPYADWVVAWTVGGGTTFMALAALVVLNHWVDVATTTPAARTILDTVAGGSLAGLVAGLYDAQSRQRFAELQIERDRVARLANKAESLNRYAKVLNESTHLDELSALSIEVVQLLVGSRESAFLLVEDGSVRIIDATVGDTSLLEAIALEVADFEPMETVHCPADTDCQPPDDAPFDSLVAIPIPAGEGTTAVLLAVPETSETYADEDIELLELLSAHMATALPDVDTGEAPPPHSSPQ